MSHESRIKLMLQHISGGHALKHYYLTSLIQHWKDISPKLKDDIINQICNRLDIEENLSYTIQALRIWKKSLEDCIKMLKENINIMGDLLKGLPESSKEFHDVIDLITRYVDVKMQLENKIKEINKELRK